MTLCIIQARLGSSRLPNKALMDIAGKPMIQHVADRVSEIRGVSPLLVVPPSDLEAFGGFCQVPRMAPHVPETDVLARFAAVAGLVGADTIMRVTGDCPLLDPRVCEQVLGLYQVARRERGVEYVWNCAPGYVDGEDCEVFTASALMWAHREATDPFDREHVTPWIRRHCKMATLMPEIDRSHLKTSVDTLEDLERVRAIYGGKIYGVGTC